MAVVAEPAEHVSELLQTLKMDSHVQAASCDRAASEVPASQDGSCSDGSRDAVSVLGGSGGNAASSTNAAAAVAAATAAATTMQEGGSVDAGMYYVNGYPTSHHAYVYDYPHGGEWDDYSRYAGIDAVELQSPGVYSDNGSVFLQSTGFGYPSQQPYSPYSPGTAGPTIGADGQLYGPQAAYQYPNHMYRQQPVSPATGQYLPSPPAIATGVELPTPGGGVGEPNPLPLGGVTGSTGLLANGNVGSGPRSGFSSVTLIPCHGPYSRGVLPVAIHTPGPQDVRFEGLRASAPSWAEVTKITEGLQRPQIAAGLHSIVSQQLSASGIPVQPVTPIAPLQIHTLPPQQWAQSALPLSNPGPGALARGYPPLPGVINGPTGGAGRAGRGGSGGGGNGLEARPNGRGGWISIDKAKHRGRGGGGSVGSPNHSSNGALDFLNEQNRGPRTTRLRNQRLGASPGILRHTRGQHGATNLPGNSSEALGALVNRELYNRPDFVTKYEHAKFFVIKSYSEDDVHKSIKYNVWASTPAGNKRLDAAFLEAQSKAGGKQGNCPVFLFFSVNASGQFCGVAEMVGPVDFGKSVEYWQQDKWNGRFTVKWHIIKDIPNCQFRHIILENNDNKPVTNSRDTQEVKFEQAIGMLNIFKSFSSKTSILDDFQFYENRQRALQDKRARQQATQQQQQQQPCDQHHQARVRSLSNENKLLLAKEAFDQQKQQEQPIETAAVGTDSVVTKAAASEPADGGGSVQSSSASSVGESGASNSSPKVKKTQSRSSPDEQSTTGSGAESVNRDFEETAAAAKMEMGTKQETDGVRELVIETTLGGGMAAEDTTAS